MFGGRGGRKGKGGRRRGEDFLIISIPL